MSPVVGGRCRDTCLNSSNVSDSGGNKQRKHSTVKVGPAGCSFPGIIVAEPVGKFTECLLMTCKCKHPPWMTSHLCWSHNVGALRVTK